MTAPVEMPRQNAAPTAEGSNVLGEHATTPALAWPFNRGVLRNPNTIIDHAGSGESPGLTIHTPSYSAFSIHAPVDARMQTVEQIDGKSTILLTTNDSSVVIVFGNLQTASPPERDLEENQDADPDSYNVVKAGAPIGTYNSTKEGLTIQIAHLSQDATTSVPNWELLDPLEVFPKYSKNS